jgi:hypothetical protein
VARHHLARVMRSVADCHANPGAPLPVPPPVR